MSNDLNKRIDKLSDKISDLSGRISAVEVNQKFMKEIIDNIENIFKSLKNNMDEIGDKIKRDEAKKEQTSSMYNKILSIPALVGVFALFYGGIVYINSSLEAIDEIIERNDE